jgi:UDP-GlcNAc:undecaprenyl-phosphate GlcNAc-1-phosphate transferase
MSIILIGTFGFGFAASLVSSLLLTRLVRDVAIKKGWQAAPTGQRHIHRKPIPRVGGVAIFLSQAGTFSAFFLFLALRHGGYPELKTFALIVPITLIFLLGLLDDACNLSAKLKLLVQIVAGTMVYAIGLRINAISFLRAGQFGGMLSFLSTVGWIILITNAFNLIDGLDGLAAGSALFSTLVLFVLALVGHGFWIALSAISLVGAILGFLYFNFNPASIFLGDCGSLFIGFTLAVLSLASSQKATTMVTVGIPVICFGLPILDVVVSISRRFLSGEKLFKADRDHIHHRLLKSGLSHRSAVLVMYALSACFGLLSLVLLQRNGTTVALVVSGVAVLVILFVGRLGYHEVDELRRVAFRTVTQRQVITHDLRFRRAGEVLRQCTCVSEIKMVLVDTFESSPFDMFDLQWGRESSNLGAEARSSRSGRGVEVAPQSFGWRKGSESRAETPAWKLDLALYDKRKRRHGILTIGRFTMFDPIPMDINLLTETFSHVLGEMLTNCTATSDFAETSFYVRQHNLSGTSENPEKTPQDTKVYVH